MSNMPEPQVMRVRRALRDFVGEPLPFLIGEPYYEPPYTLRRAIANAAFAGGNRYGDPAGETALRDAICAIERNNGLEITPENVVIGNGSKGLLYGLLGLLGGRGVIVPTPAYPAMLAQARLLNLPLRTVAAPPPEFIPDADGFPRVDSGCLVICSPSNPTGRICPPVTMGKLLSWCRSRSTILIADEVYRELDYSGAASGFGGLDPRLESTVIVRSFSKTLGICGWRMGYVLASRDIAAALARWQSLALNPPSTLMQQALAACGEEWFSEIRGHARHFAGLASQLADLFRQFGCRVAEPQGAFYLFFESAALGDGSSAEICERLARESGIALWPGEDFGTPGWIRLSFGGIAPHAALVIIAELRRRLSAFMAHVEVQSVRHC